MNKHYFLTCRRFRAQCNVKFLLHYRDGTGMFQNFNFKLLNFRADLQIYVTITNRVNNHVLYLKGNKISRIEICEIQEIPW